jgi:hypothetical protein
LDGNSVRLTLGGASEERLTMCGKARPTGAVAVIALALLVAFARPAGHFFGEAALFIAIAVATAGAAVAAACAFAAFLAARRKQPRRLHLASTQQRSLAGPRWPDRPILRAESISEQAPGPTGHAGQKERARSTALSFALGAGDLSGASVRFSRRAPEHGSPLGHGDQLRDLRPVNRAPRPGAAVTPARPDPSGV